LWILDEPFTALDAAATDLLKQKIENFANDGGMVVMTSHQDFSLNVPHFMPLKLDA
jgi:heme exporter protein A